MKKLLNMLLLTETISVSCLPIIGCKQENKPSNNLPNSIVQTTPTVHNSTNKRVLNKAVELIGGTKIHKIQVQEFGKKDVVINAMKEMLFNAQNRFSIKVEFDGEMDVYFIDDYFNSNTLIELENQNLISHSSLFYIIAVLKCDNEKKSVSFKIKLV